MNHNLFDNVSNKEFEVNYSNNFKMLGSRNKMLKYIESSPLIFQKILFVVMMGISLALLTGCSSKTTNVTIPLEPPENFSDSGPAEIPEKWWTSFEDEELNTLVDSALASNFNLKTAWQRLLASQAIVDRESSGLYPDFGATFQGGVDYPQPDFAGGESFRLGLSSEYEVDLWGRIRSSIEAERFRAGASFSDYQTAALTLSTEIVRTWFQLLEEFNQLRLIEEQIDINEEMLKLIKNRFGSGLVRSVDILRQRQLLESTLEQKYTIESVIKILKHQLNVLMGQPPLAEITFADTSLPALPPAPETGIPAELVQRRPDVQSAFNRLLAADRDLASAISNKYPRFSINATTSVRANNVDDLFEGWAYSLAGNLFAPIFQGGALQAEVDRSEAVKNQLLYEYGQTILIAFQKVEDAITREKNQIERIESLEKQATLARQTYEQLRLEYFNGMSNDLDVLTALDQEQQLRRDVLSANQILLQYRVNLYQALAGDFGMTENEFE